MIPKYQEAIREVLEYVKGYANEVVHQMTKEEKNKVQELICTIKDLEDELNDFEELINLLWERAESSVFK
jgi:TRAP-type C4-dicarboxylate transport system substrate-binding protein